MRMLPYVLVIGLAVYALIDLGRSTVLERAGLHLAAWVAIILVPVLGPGAWLLVSRYQRGDIGAPPGAGGPPRPPVVPRRPGMPGGPRRGGPRAPDDDPDFLRGLGRGRRRRPGDGGGPPHG